MDLKIFQINNSCTGCGACVNVCPRACLTLNPDSEGFYFPQYDEKQCIGCHLCEKVCHVINPLPANKVTNDSFYMYQSKEMQVRQRSSSGGAFSLFAQSILKQNGVVFGCKYDGAQEKLVFSNSTTDKWELFRKSKYIEAFTGDSYKKVALLLQGGQIVFYCGTPCQIRGLMSYLTQRKVTLDNLLTADFICHGVPSNGCFTAYKRQFERNNKKVVNVDFRYKDFKDPQLSWHNMVLCLEYNDKTKKIIPYKAPYFYGYYKIFMDNIILRKCCYNCHFPSISCADITFADFWGINKFRSEVDDNTGISVVKLHSSKAKKMWASFKTPTELLPYDAVKYLYAKPDKRQILPQRERFFDLYSKYGYLKAIRKYYRKDLFRYYTIGVLKQFVKTLIHR